MSSDFRFQVNNFQNPDLWKRIERNAKTYKELQNKVGEWYQGYNDNVQKIGDPILEAKEAAEKSNNISVLKSLKNGKASIHNTSSDDLTIQQSDMIGRIYEFKHKYTDYTLPATSITLRPTGNENEYKLGSVTILVEENGDIAIGKRDSALRIEQDDITDGFLILLIGNNPDEIEEAQITGAITPADIKLYKRILTNFDIELPKNNSKLEAIGNVQGYGLKKGKGIKRHAIHIDHDAKLDKLEVIIAEIQNGNDSKLMKQEGHDIISNLSYHKLITREQANKLSNMI